VANAITVGTSGSGGRESPITRFDAAFGSFLGVLLHLAPKPRRTPMDAPATPEQKARLAALSPEDVKVSKLADDPITSKLTRTSGNGAPICGMKVVAAGGWFAARPSGTEDIYKIYAESFQGANHLRRILQEAQSMVREALAAAPQSQGSRAIKSKGYA
jgi:hypothetical protein